MLAKINEPVKRIVRNTTAKNRNGARKASGGIKKKIMVKIPQRITVTRSVGKKFLLLRNLSGMLKYSISCQETLLWF